MKVEIKIDEDGSNLTRFYASSHINNGSDLMEAANKVSYIDCRF